MVEVVQTSIWHRYWLTCRKLKAVQQWRLDSTLIVDTDKKKAGKKIGLYCLTKQTPPPPRPKTNEKRLHVLSIVNMSISCFPGWAWSAVLKTQKRERFVSKSVDDLHPRLSAAEPRRNLYCSCVLLWNHRKPGKRKGGNPMSRSISKGWERNKVSVNFNSVTFMLITGEKNSNNVECTVQKINE